MSINALGLYVGLVLVHDNRQIRLVEDLGDWVLRFIDVDTGHDYVVACDATDELLNPNVMWLFTEKEAGRLSDPAETRDIEGRRRSFMGLDKSACTARDRKSAWRFRWAWAVMTEGPETTSDDVYRDWIASRPDLIPDEQGVREAVPKGSTLRRWERKLKAARGQRGVLVSCAGRLKGQSQLKGLEDWIVHDAATWFWSTEDQMIVDAGGTYIDLRDQLVAAGAEHLLEQNPVRLETIRKRVRSLEGRATTAAKEGERQAKRMFDPIGQGVPTERFLERVQVDGVELRQIVHFSDDWKVAAHKMKLINVIDEHTCYWWLPPSFCGPYRPEMTIAAMMGMMTPPAHFTPEEIAENPSRGEAWGTPDLVEPDNERAIFAPSDIAAFTELGPTFELPKTNHGDGKPLVEALNRFIKGWFEGLPGTVRGPRRPKDPSRNAVKEAEMTRAQIRAEIVKANRYWNELQRPQFGNRSALEMVQACRDAGHKPKRNPPLQVRRALARTHERIELTRNGFEFDGVRYESEDFGAVVDANYKNTGFKDRVDGTSKVLVSIRTFEDNLHEVEVYDEERRRFVGGTSTQPELFLHLSRYEWTEFKAMEATAKPGRQRDEERMRARSGRLAHAAAELPRARGKAAAAHATLLESDEFRRASGVRAHSADFGPALVNGILAASGRDVRTDVPATVPTPAGAKTPPPPNAPASLLAAMGIAGVAEPAPGATTQAAPEDGEARQHDANSGAGSGDDEFRWPELPPDDEEEEGDDH